jgi:CRP/FNR family transcriptional regulator/CRP/FNR family cyclic AMP-dependent transcriptional regulator
MELLQRVPFLANLAKEDLAWLARRVRRRSYPRGDIIFQKDDPGESLFLVESGSVAISVPGVDGSEMTLARVGPGDFFGDMSLLDGSPRSASAVAAAESTLLVLERDDFIGLIRQRPEAALSILAVITQRLRGSDEMISDLRFLDAGGRLARRLLDLAADHGVRRQDGILLNMRLTQEELATMIGVTRESVNRNLSEFRRRGLVRNEGRKIVILDPDGLQSYCE